MPFDTIANGAPSIFVSTEAELQAAYTTLSNTSGGGKIYLAANADGIRIELDEGGNNPVEITSADPTNPVTVNRIALDEISNVKVSHVDVFSNGGVGRPDWHDDMSITNASQIELESVNFKGIATGIYGPEVPGSTLAESLGLVRWSEDVTIADSSIDGYYHGLTFMETTHVTVTGTEITGMQGDGLRLAGAAQVSITDNHFHNFHGTTNDFNHNDMIQMWSYNTTIVARDIDISGNIFDSGDGASSQTIFLGNESLRGMGGDRQTYQNINITDNLIYNGHPHGISVYGANNVTVEGNTLLWNQDAEMVYSYGQEGYSSEPLIRLDTVTNGSISNNISSGISETSGAAQSNNVVLTYTSANDPYYVDTHFTNVFQGGDVGLEGLRLLADSPLVGMGADASAPLTATDDGVAAHMLCVGSDEDMYCVQLDASNSVDENGTVDPGDYTFRWVFSDGTVREGVQVMHQFADGGDYDIELQVYQNGQLVDTTSRDYTVQSKELLDITFSGGQLDDASDYDSDLSGNGSFSGGGYRIGGSTRLEVARENLQIHDLENFGLSLDLRTNDDGRFLHFHTVMEGYVDPDGTVRFKLYTDEGTFEVDSGSVRVDNNAYHNIAIGYADEAGQLIMEIDGQQVGAVAASGKTAPPGYQPFLFGSNFQSAVNATIDNIKMNADPAAVGIPMGLGVDQALLDATLVSGGTPPPPEPGGSDDDEDDGGETGSGSGGSTGSGGSGTGSGTDEEETGSGSGSGTGSGGETDTGGATGAGGGTGSGAGSGDGQGGGPGSGTGAGGGTGSGAGSGNGRAGVRPSIQAPLLYEETNVGGTLRLLDASVRHGVENFVLASSSSVYGNSTSVPFVEDDSATDRPISPYAATKKSAELLGHTYHVLHGLNVNVVRPFTVYGPRGRPDMAPWLFVEAAMQERPITKFGDGTSARDYTFIDDFVTGFMGAVDREFGFEIFNLGNATTVSLNEAIETIGRIHGTPMQVNTVAMQPGDVTITHADISKAKRDLGYAPKTSFEEGMSIFYQWYQSVQSEEPDRAEQSQ